MQVHYGFKSYKNIKNPIVTVGTFDGVHFGHQKIIQRLQKIAKKNNGESVLLTFDPHPRKILLNDQGLKLIHTINEKINILAISTSEIKLSVIIEAHNTLKAIKKLHTIFDLD